MTKLKSLKKIKEDMKCIQKSIEDHIKNAKKEHRVIIYNTKNNLLELIAENESLDIEYLKKKYLGSNKKDKNIKKNISEENDIDELLEVINLEGNEYYYEDKEDGIVYDRNSNNVGKFIKNKIVFNKSSI